MAFPLMCNIFNSAEKRASTRGRQNRTSSTREAAVAELPAKSELRPPQAVAEAKGELPGNEQKNE